MLTGSQSVKKFPAFYGTRRFITAFKTARHLSLFWAHQYSPCPTFLKIHLNITLPSTPEYPSGLFPSGFLTKTVGIHDIET